MLGRWWVTNKRTGGQELHRELWFAMKPWFQRNPGSEWVDHHHPKQYPAAEGVKVTFAVLSVLAAVQYYAHIPRRRPSLDSTSSQAGDSESRMPPLRRTVSLAESFLDCFPGFERGSMTLRTVYSWCCQEVLSEREG